MTSPAPANPNLQPARWRFGDSELDEFRLEILHLGEVVPLEAKALELLRQFVRHPGEVLTKDELMEAVWPGRVLSESVLARAISLLRKALADSSQTLIRTVHGYGYRFDVPVERLTPVKTQSAPTLHLQAGQNPPLRPNWQLVERLGEGRNETWLVEHDKTRERRVFKFAGDGIGLSTLKREITLQRLLIESLGDQAAVVPVLDWNLQEAPYFIETEWCSGGSLERWLAVNASASVETRIDLVAQAAEALAAAHAVGVLHKDVKPQNLLIVEAGGEPQVRLADFGSGLLIDDTRLQSLSITRLGLTRTNDDESSGSGSMLYLAPEVVAGQPATLKSDVYALGVLLFQVIVGDLRRPLAPGWERDITDPLLREDIAAAAELDPARRLADAAALAQRLRGLARRRWEQENRRIESERLETVRRQLESWKAKRGWIGGAFAALVAGFAVSTWLYVDARSARDSARQAEARAGAVNQFLLDDLLAATDPDLAGRPTISVRELLELAAVKAGERFRDQPIVEASVRRSLGSAMLGVGDFAKAEPQFRTALDLLDPQAKSYAQTASNLHLDLARVMYELEDYDKANIEARQSLDLADAVGLKAESVAARTELAFLLCMSNRYDEALAELDGLEAEAAALPDNDALMLRISRYHADTLAQLGRLEESLKLRWETLEAAKKLYSPTHVELLLIRKALGVTLAIVGRQGEALDQLEALQRDAESALGKTHRLSLSVAESVAAVLVRLNQIDRAIDLFRSTLAAQIETLGPQHTDTQITRGGLAEAYSLSGRADQAVVIEREVLANHIARFGEKDTLAVTSGHNLGRYLQETGNWQEAAQVQRHTLDAAQGLLGDDHYIRLLLTAALARSLGELGDYDQAEGLFDKAIAGLKKLPSLDSRYLKRAEAWRVEIEALSKKRPGAKAGASIH